jgi:hypothetical protein
MKKWLKKLLRRIVYIRRRRAISQQPKSDWHSWYEDILDPQQDKHKQ